jgi:phosphoenolpyruvate synthase/pyruvate phosphate dikinase
MHWIISPENIHQEDRPRVGGKGYALALLLKGGFRVPKTFCVTSDTYHEYVFTGAESKIIQRYALGGNLGLCHSHSQPLSAQVDSF